RVRGAFDVEAFAASWRVLCRRHASLRTAFLYQGVARPLQVVLRDRGPEIATREAREAEIDAARRADLARGFDLTSDALVRVTILRLAADDHVVIWSHHHIVMDGWSFGVLNAELAVIYAARAEGSVAALPPPAPYAAYIRWLETRDRQA